MTGRRIIRGTLKCWSAQKMLKGATKLRSSAGGATMPERTVTLWSRKKE